MDFVTARELRAESAKIWKKLEAGEDIVVTRNGKPFALLVHTEPTEVDEKLRALRAARFRTTVDETRRIAGQQGLDQMSEDAIDAEIAQARKDRHQRAQSRR